MIRYSLLTGAVVFVLVYAWRDWYKSLCATILFMAVYLRPDMPRTMLGMPGLNLFNLMLLNVVMAWAASRQRERLSWDMPGSMNALLLLYLAVVVVAFLRMVGDPANPKEASTTILICGSLLNTVKWVLPGLLLYDGCRTRSRFVYGLLAVLGMYLLLALQVARLVSPTVDEAELVRRSLKILDLRIGYHRVDLSTMLAGASWAVFAARALFPKASQRMAVLGASVVVFYGQLLTAGRAGYVAWAVVGLILCSLRWRLLLLVAPVAVAGVVSVVPAVADRLMEGIHLEDESRQEDLMEGSTIDEKTLTAGRAQVWPLVVAKILERPVLGYGALAMRRAGVSRLAGEQYGAIAALGHPHNAYLELLLDSGLVGFCLVMPFYVVVVLRGFRLFCDSANALFIAAGGAATALVLAQLVGSLGSQSFYPREGTVGMWCAMMLMLRVWVERSRSLAPGLTVLYR